MSFNQIIFITIFFTSYFLLHVYIVFSLKKSLTINKRLTFYISFLILLFASMYPIARIFHWYGFFIYIASIWLGIASITTVVFIIKDFLSLFLKLNKRKATYVSFLVIVIISTYSFINEKNIRVVEIDLETNKNIKPFSFVLLSDLHIDSIKNEKWIKELVFKVNALEPDVVFIAGDIVDGRSVLNMEKANELSKLKSKYGVFACLGNHEYYTGRVPSLEFLRQANIKVLINEGISVRNDIYIAGIDDEQGEIFGFQGPNISVALMHAKNTDYTILLSHRPHKDYFEKAKSLNVDIMLSGHTHAGQIPPFDILVNLLYKYPYGLYKADNTMLYTSSGAGSWGPPMRFLNNSEVVLFKVL